MGPHHIAPLLAAALVVGVSACSFSDSSDWELDTGTYLAIGQGLRKGGLKPIELAAWKSNLAGSDLSRADLIQKGYDGTP